MSKIIECQVNDEYILGSGVPIGAVGSFGDVILRLEFNEMWDGLTIYATFKDALGQGAYVEAILPSMLVEGEVRTYDVPIPLAATKYPGRTKLTLTGYSVYTINENGEKIVKKDSVTNTATAFFRVLESESSFLDDGSVDATLREQLLASQTRFEEDILERQQLIEEAEAGRNAAEIARRDAEGGRREAEDERVRDETYRAALETARVEAENERVSAEKERQRAEVLRDSEEIERAGGEVVRRRAEDARVEAENDRVTAENKRVEAEIARQQGYQDIGEALDRIIAIQNELIGGLITFTVIDNTLTAERGMTWSEFVDSEYNIYGYYIQGDYIICGVHTDIYVTNEDGYTVTLPSDVIVDGAKYGHA